MELHGGSNLLGQRVRRPGGGRKRAVALQPGLLATLEALIEDAIRGDPETEINDAEVKQLVDQVTAPPSGAHPATSTSAPSTNAVK